MNHLLAYMSSINPVQEFDYCVCTIFPPDSSFIWYYNYSCGIEFFMFYHCEFNKTVNWFYKALKSTCL